MTKRLSVYGTGKADSAATVGGKNKTPRSLAARMPSAQIAAKVGQPPSPMVSGSIRVVRLRAQG